MSEDRTLQVAGIGLFLWFLWNRSKKMGGGGVIPFTGKGDSVAIWTPPQSKDGEGFDSPGSAVSPYNRYYSGQALVTDECFPQEGGVVCVEYPLITDDPNEFLQQVQIVDVRGSFRILAEVVHPETGVKWLRTAVVEYQPGKYAHLLIPTA